MCIASLGYAYEQLYLKCVLVNQYDRHGLCGPIVTLSLSDDTSSYRLISKMLNTCWTASFHTIHIQDTLMPMMLKYGILISNANHAK